MKHVPVSFGSLVFPAGFFGLMISCISPNNQSGNTERNLNDINSLLREHTCLACHAVHETLVGPSYMDIARRDYSTEEIIQLIKYPVPENWPGFPPMAAVQNIPDDEALEIARWIN